MLNYGYGVLSISVYTVLSVSSERRGEADKRTQIERHSTGKAQQTRLTTERDMGHETLKPQNPNDTAALTYLPARESSRRGRW